MERPPRPFRWDVANGAQLGSMAAGVEVETLSSFLDDLMWTSARVLERSADSDLVFVGRSPESIFDLMSGLFAETQARERLELLPLSLGERADMRAIDVTAFRDYLTSADLDPQAIASRARPVAFVDLVYSGGTFSTLIALLHEWSAEVVQWQSVARKVRLVGITIEGKTSPKAWRWWQHSDAARVLRPSAIKNVSAPFRLWGFLGNVQPKAAGPFRTSEWRDPDVELPLRNEEARAALATAVWLYEHGRTRAARAEFVSQLAAAGALRHAWLRSLAAEFKRAGGSSGGR